MDGHIRSFSDIKCDKFDEENLPTITSSEQVNEHKIPTLF